MIGLGAVSMLLVAIVLWRQRRGRVLADRRLLKVAGWAGLLPFAANAAGWIFTETARQPWLVYGVLKTEDGLSPGVSTTEVASTLVGSTLLYAGLGFIALRIFLKISRQGPITPVSDADPWLSPPDHRPDPEQSAPEPALVD